MMSRNTSTDDPSCTGGPGGRGGSSHRQRDRWLQLLAVIAIGFGLLTLKEGGMTLAGNAAAVAAAGNYVPFVLWFNFLAGFAYVAAGVGLFMQRRWAIWLALIIVAATGLVFVALGVHVAYDGAYERRTAIAMVLRLTVWQFIAAVAWWRLRRESQ